MKLFISQLLCLYCTSLLLGQVKETQIGYARAFFGNLTKKNGIWVAENPDWKDGNEKGIKKFLLHFTKNEDDAIHGRI